MLRKLFNPNRFVSRRFCGGIHTPRERLDYDVVIVGGGPAGISAAIRLKQLALEKGTEVSVCILEKGSEIGAHILSGNVFEPRALNELLPNWKELGAPLETKAGHDEFLILSETGSTSIPQALIPKQLHNEGNYVISLSALVRWLGTQAENLGVEIYPGFSISEILYNTDGTVCGVATRDSGISKDGDIKDTFTRGVSLHGKQIIFAEGCRGSCTTELIEKFNLSKDKDVQSYGLGVKEVWTIPEANIKPGFIQHTLGWPLQSNIFDKTFGGTFLYHAKPNLVYIGMVVGLDYQNTYLSPYKEFQRWKHHPDIKKHLEGGECISYGARCLNEGGYHAIPKLTFPGGVIVGCGAGFLNSAKIKGSHTAMKSGMLAAEAIYDLMQVYNDVETPEGIILEAKEYETNLYKSWIAEELYIFRNAHAAFHYGLLPGMVHSGFSSFVSLGREPWTIQNTNSDSSKTLPAKDCEKINYPKPDGVISFDLLTNLQRSGTYHEADQPAHLRIKPGMEAAPKESITVYDGPEQRFCPAGVYEYTEATSEGDASTRDLVINAQNCVHCKCCSIKTPNQYINWTVPEGGGGPAYTNM